MFRFPANPPAKCLDFQQIRCWREDWKDSAGKVHSFILQAPYMTGGGGGDEYDTILVCFVFILFVFSSIIHVL